MNGVYAFPVSSFVMMHVMPWIGNVQGLAAKRPMVLDNIEGKLRTLQYFNSH